MSTFMANKGNIVRKWYVVDAAGKPLGHTAVIVADLLRGKRKPDFTPIARLCQELGVTYHLVPVPIYEIVFTARQEKNP